MSNANDILQQTLETYSQCATYYDEGEIPDAGFGRPGLIFKTRFVRPHLFRPFYGRLGPSMGQQAVGRDEESAYHDYDFVVTKLAKRCDRLSLAIAGATGISLGTAHFIALLLMPDMMRQDRQWRATNLFPDETINGDACHHIEAFWGVLRYDLWINQEDLSLRKVRHHRVVGHRSTDLGRQLLDALIYTVTVQDCLYNGEFKADFGHDVFRFRG